MKIHGSQSSTGALQSFGWALIASVAGALLYLSVFVDELIEPEVMSNSLGLFIYGIINAICCFYIVRHCPISIWFVPLIMNAFVIAMAIMEPNIFRSPLWLPVCGGSLLCVIASIAGAFIGNNTTTSHHPFENA